MTSTTLYTMMNRTESDQDFAQLALLEQKLLAHLQLAHRLSVLLRCALRISVLLVCVIERHFQLLNGFLP